MASVQLYQHLPTMLTIGEPATTDYEPITLIPTDFAKKKPGWKKTVQLYQHLPTMSTIGEPATTDYEPITLIPTNLAKKKPEWKKKLKLQSAVLRLRWNDSTLTDLVLEYNNSIGDSGARKLANALEKNTVLIALELTSMNIEKEGASALAKSLKTNKILRKLDFSVNRIGAEGVRSIARALEVNTAITDLLLEFNEIGDKGAEALAEALFVNKALKQLNLQGNCIGNEGATALARALKLNIFLKRLYLDDNDIGTAGAKALADALGMNTTLTHLALNGMSLGAEGARAIANVLQKNTTVTLLDREGNKIGAEGVMALAGDLDKDTASAAARTKTTTQEPEKKSIIAEVAANKKRGQDSMGDSSETMGKKAKTQIQLKDTDAMVDNLIEMDEPDDVEESMTVKMFESGIIDFQTKYQSRISLHMSSIREVDNTGLTNGIYAFLKKTKFACLPAGKETKLVKVFGDSKQSADDSGIAKGTHSFMTADLDDNHSLKVHAHQVTMPGKAGTDIENFDLMCDDIMFTVELSKSNASGGQDTHRVGEYVDLEIEIHTSGNRIYNIPGLEFAYYLGGGTRMDLTNRYFESLDYTDNFKVRFMPEGFPKLMVDRNDNSKGVILLRFHRFEGDGEIFYDPWFRWMSNREGRYSVGPVGPSDSRIPVQFGPKFPEVHLTDPIVDVIGKARRRLYPEKIVDDLCYKIFFNEAFLEEFTSDQACFTTMDLFDTMSFYSAVKSWQTKVVFNVDILKVPRLVGDNAVVQEEAFNDLRIQAEEANRTEVPIIAPEDCKIMVSFNDFSAGEDAEKLANFLTSNGHPTFCTRLYCPLHPGSWRDATDAGVATCEYYVMLLTNGWQISNECQYETNTAINRWAGRTLIPIPVLYDDFDKDFDKNGGLDRDGIFMKGKHYQIRFQSIETVYHSTSDTWMKKVLRLLPK